MKKQIKAFDNDEECEDEVEEVEDELGSTWQYF